MSETAEPRPTPTHVVEVYLADTNTLIGVARTDRFFFGAEAVATIAYHELSGYLNAAPEKNNDLPLTIEVDDLYGSGRLVPRDLRGVRLFDIEALDDWEFARQAKKSDAKRRAAKAAEAGL
jgi:hypothetical protein